MRALDCANNPRDAGLAHRIYSRSKRAWAGQSDEMKKAVVEDVDAGRRRAREILDAAQDDAVALAAIDRINTSARVHAIFEAQEQAERHHADDVERGRGVVNVNVGIALKVSPPRVIGQAEA